MTGMMSPFAGHTLDLRREIPVTTPDYQGALRRLDSLVRTELVAQLRPDEAFRGVGPCMYTLFFPQLSGPAGLARFEEIAARVRSRMAASNVGARGGIPLAAAPTATVPPAATIASQPAPGPRRAPVGAPDSRLRFHPVWNIPQNFITGYRCVFDLPPDRADDLAALVGPGPIEQVRARADALMYSQAVAALDAMAWQNIRVLLIVPIHFSTLEGSGAAMFDTVRLTPEAVRHLVFEVIGVPPSASTLRVRHPLGLVASRSRALVARIDFEFSNVEMFRDFRFHAIGLDAAHCPWREGKLIAYFEHFATLASQQALSSFVHSLPTTSLATSAIGAGFTYVDGDAILPAVNMPQPIQGFPVTRLYG